MAKQTKSTGSEAVKPAAFDPKSLTIEQQEAVVEEYLGYPPKFFMYEGTKIRFNRSRYEAESRNATEANPKIPRLWFNGWKPKEYKW